MTFNELNPTIQSWIDSDEFIDSLVSVVQEFNLQSSAPLSEAIIGLALKRITPVEFKIKLLTSLPEDKRGDALVAKLVNLSLLPVKGPLAESGIDISVIAPLDEVGVIPYDPNAKPKEETEEITEEAGPVSPLDELPPEGNTISPVESSPAPAANPVSEMNESAPTANGAAPVINESAPLTPNFDANTEPLAAPLIDQASASAPAPAPFVIHEEKTVERTSASANGASPIRPMFYSAEPEARGNTPVVNIEFGKPETSKKIDPNNVVDLNDLPL